MEGEGGREREGGEGGGEIYRRRENGVWSHICTQASKHTHTHTHTHTPRSHSPSTPLLPQLAHSTGSPTRLQSSTGTSLLYDSRIQYIHVHVYNTCIVWAPYTYLHCTLCGKYV